RVLAQMAERLLVEPFRALGTGVRIGCARSRPGSDREDRAERECRGKRRERAGGAHPDAGHGHAQIIGVAVRAVNARSGRGVRVRTIPQAVEERPSTPEAARLDARMSLERRCEIHERLLKYSALVPTCPQL